LAFSQESKINSLSLAFAGAKDNPLKMVKNAIERLDDKLSNVWLFAGSWASDVESLHHVVLQESVKPLCGILLARVKMQAGLVMLLSELDGLLGASAQAGSKEIDLKHWGRGA
jgi:hypothetical protein